VATTARVTFAALNATFNGYDMPGFDTLYHFYDAREAIETRGTSATWYVLRACFVTDQAACWDSPRFHVSSPLEVFHVVSDQRMEMAATLMGQTLEVDSGGLAVVRVGGALNVAWAMYAIPTDGVTTTLFLDWDGGSAGSMTLRRTVAAWLMRAERDGNAWSSWQRCTKLDIASVLADPTRFVAKVGGLAVSFPVPPTVVCDLLPAGAGNFSYSVLLETNVTIRGINGAVLFFAARNTTSNRFRFQPAVVTPPSLRDVTASMSSEEFDIYRSGSVNDNERDEMGQVQYLGTTLNSAIPLYSYWNGDRETTLPSFTEVATVTDGSTAYHLWQSDSQMWGGAVRAHIDYTSLVLAAVWTGRWYGDSFAGIEVVAELDTSPIVTAVTAGSRYFDFSFPDALPALLPRSAQNGTRGYAVGMSVGVRVTMANGSVVFAANHTFWSWPFHLRSPTPDVTALAFKQHQLRLVSVVDAAALFGVNVPLDDNDIPVVRLGGKVHVGVAAAFNVTDGWSNYQLLGTGGPLWDGTVTSRLTYTLGVIRVGDNTPAVSAALLNASCIALRVTDPLRAAGAFAANAAGRNTYLTFTLPATAGCNLLPLDHQNNNDGYALGLRVDVEVVDSTSGAVLLADTYSAVTPLFHLYPANTTQGSGNGSAPGSVRNGTLVQVPMVFNVSSPSGGETVSRMVAALVDGGAGVGIRNAFSELVGAPLDSVVIVAVVDHLTGRVHRFAWYSPANGRTAADGGNGVTASSIPTRRRRLGGSDDAANVCGAPDLTTSTLSDTATAGGGAAMTVVLGVYVPPPSCTSGGGGSATEADADAVATGATATVDALAGAAVNGATNAFTAAAIANLAISAGVDSSIGSASLPPAGVAVDAGLARSDTPAGGGGGGAPSGRAAPRGSSRHGAVVGGAVGGAVALVIVIAVVVRAYCRHGGSAGKKPVADADAAAPAPAPAAAGAAASPPTTLVTNPKARAAALATYRYNKMAPPVAS